MEFPDFFDNLPGGPLGIHQTPSSVDVDCVPGVLIFVWIELHAGIVVDPFTIAANDYGVYSSITESIENKLIFDTRRPKLAYWHIYALHEKKYTE